MEHIRVNSKIELESVSVSMTDVIFETIDRNRNFLSRWLPFADYTQSKSDTENFIKSVVNQPGRKRDEVYSIWYKSEFAGLIGFKETDWINRKTELGYWLAERMQGKGIITACTEKLIRFAFQKLNMNRVQVKVAVGNKRSAAIPQKLGFKLEGVERDGERHQNTYFDLEVYSYLKSDLTT
jgi:ribosomal-protein-serine acetyltransferase